MSERLPPHNVEAERAVLGSVLIRPSVFPEVEAALERDDFFLPAHREIFESMCLLAKAETPVDPITVGDSLRVRDELGRLEGGADYLVSLLEAVPTAENAAHYVRLVRNSANQRRLLALCMATASHCYRNEAEFVDELIENMTGDLMRLLANRRAARITRLGDLMAGRLAAIEERARRAAVGQSPLTGVRTGLQALDDVLGGLEPGNVMFVGADTGGGKTALVFQMALTLALDDDGTALVCELEMTNEELADRALVHQARVNSHRVRRGDVDADAMERLVSAGARLGAPLVFLDDRAFTVRDIGARARHWRAKYPPPRKGLLVVDFVQLLRAADGRNGRDSRARELGIMCADLKLLAKELAVPVVIAAQLNREGAKKTDAPPSIHDFKDSSDIEQDADAIVMLWNHSGLEGQPTEDGPVEAIVGKNRNGIKRTVPLWWQGRYYRFSDGDAAVDPLPAPPVEDEGDVYRGGRA